MKWASPEFKTWRNLNILDYPLFPVSFFAEKHQNYLKRCCQQELYFVRATRSRAREIPCDIFFIRKCFCFFKMSAELKIFFHFLGSYFLLASQVVLCLFQFCFVSLPFCPKFLGKFRAFAFSSLYVCVCVNMHVCVCVYVFQLDIMFCQFLN